MRVWSLQGGLCSGHSSESGRVWTVLPIWRRISSRGGGRAVPQGSLSLLLRQAVDSILPLGDYSFTEIVFSAGGELGLSGYVSAPQGRLLFLLSDGGLSSCRRVS